MCIRDRQGAEQIFIPVAVSADAVQHPGELALEDGDGRLEFMGGGGEKGRPLPVQFPDVYKRQATPRKEGRTSFPCLTRLYAALPAAKATHQMLFMIPPAYRISYG